MNSIPISHSKINPSKPRRSKQSRPHGHPQPTRYRPPSRPARYMLDVGRNVSLAMTLARHNVAPNALTLTKIGGKDE